MAETFETLKTKLGDWLAVDATRFPDGARGDCLNFIQREVIRNHDLRFGEMTDTPALTANTPSYALPATWRSPLSLWYTNPATGSLVNLVRLSKDQIDARYSDPADTGTPAHYAVWGALLYIGPTPDQAITLNRNYYGFLDDLADGSPNNTNAFVQQAHDVLFYGALEHASRYLLEDPRAPMWGAHFRQLESDLANEHRREKSSGLVPQSMEPG